MMGVFLAFFMIITFASNSYGQTGFIVNDDTKAVLKNHYESLRGKTMPSKQLELMIIPTTRNVRTWTKVKTVIQTRRPEADVSVLEEFISELTGNVPEGN